MKPNESVLGQFNLDGEIVFLPGGENRTYKIGNFVLKHINKDSEEYTSWIANLFANIEENNFRVSKPISTNDGKWITTDGWSAWTFLEGNHEFKNHIPESIDAITAFHKAIAYAYKPNFLNDDNPYNRADRCTWDDKPDYIDLQVKDLVESLYSVRKPVEGLKDQVIHGDLNPDNILLSPNLPPAIIDIAPYWRPPEFALAVYAYWIAAYRNDPDLLRHFAHVKQFNQMIIRAGIRMLLIMSEFHNVHEIDKYRRATEIIHELIEA